MNYRYNIDKINRKIERIMNDSKTSKVRKIKELNNDLDLILRMTHDADFGLIGTKAHIDIGEFACRLIYNAWVSKIRISLKKLGSDYE